jgi:peptidoglycan-associated lipoprotein
MNMSTQTILKPWLVAGLVAIFTASCATTQEELIDDGAPTEEQMQDQSGEFLLDGDSSADATGLDGSDSGTATAFGDSSQMTARELLEQTEGQLSNRTIYFEFDSAKLSSESLALLEAHGNFVAGNGEVSVRLEGHTDERGSREYNIALGDRRAQSVRRVLLFQGASSDQIDTVSFGEEKAVAFGHDEEAWNKNRRVELIYQVK